MSAEIMSDRKRWLIALTAGLLVALAVGLTPVWNAAGQSTGGRDIETAADNAMPAPAGGAVPVMAGGEISWKRSGVVLDLGWRGEPDDKNIESPLVVKTADDSYVMFYRGQSYADKLGRVMRAVSADGINWKKTGVVMTPCQPYEGDKIDPMAVIYEGGIYKMWYGGQAYGGCACYATSPDGINWSRYDGNPVLRKTSGSWDNEGAGGQHTVIKDGDRYLMYYKGYGKNDPGWTFYGLAESADGIRWMKKGKAVIPEPALGETTTFKNMHAFKAGGTYFILHTMADYLSLFLLTSTDGINWMHRGLAFQKGMTTGGSDIKWATSPCVLIENGIIRMWYEGGDGSGRVRTHYAETPVENLLNRAR